MSDLVFIAFDSEQKAEEVRDRVLEMQKEYLIDIGDAVIAVRDDKGRVKLNQLMNTTAAGAASGALWGTLIGMLFMMPLFLILPLFIMPWLICSGSFLLILFHQFDKGDPSCKFLPADIMRSVEKEELCACFSSKHFSSARSEKFFVEEVFQSLLLEHPAYFYQLTRRRFGIRREAIGR